MSRLCMAIINKNHLSTCAIKQIIDDIVTSLCFDIFLVTECTEPFLEEMNCEDKFILSFADNNQFDNCEMLLLPDGCFCGGYSNEILFEERMKQIEAFLSHIMNWTGTVELFIGDSGSRLYEYEHHNIRIRDFMKKVKYLNSIIPPDLHLTICSDSETDWGQGIERRGRKTGDGLREP